MKEPRHKGLKPSFSGKVKAAFKPVCHECKEPIDEKTALRIPAYDVHPPGSRYLICSISCNKYNLPVLQVGA